MNGKIIHLDEIVRILTTKHSLNSYTTEVNAACLSGDNYVGNIYSLKLSGARNVSVIVKVATDIAVLRKYVPIEVVSQREIYIYKEVLPRMEKFQRDIENPNIFVPAPEVFYINSEKGSETLVLDDLMQYNYKMWNRKLLMDHEHVSLVLQNYGRLHALSFAMRDKKPDMFYDLVKSIDLIFFIHCTSRDDIKFQMNVIKPYFDDESEKEIKDKLDRITDIGRDLLEIALEENEFSVVGHGDCWSNNMMFQYNDTSNPTKPTNMRFIDFQLATYGSVVLDLSYFIYSCGSKAVLDDLDKYLKIYYDSFSLFLSELGSDSQKLFTFENLKQEWKRSFLWGVLHAMFLIRLLLVDSENAFHLEELIQKGTDIDAYFKTGIKIKDQEYKRRMRDLVLHLHENDFI